MIKKPKRDFGFILSLGIIIAVGGYWFVKEMPVDNLEPYIDYLGNKLVELVPKEQEKQEVSRLYDRFKEQVNDKKIEPEEVEKVAAAIINLSNARDSLSLEEALSLLENVRADISVDSTYIESMPELAEKNGEWKRLQEKLGRVYKLEEKLSKKHLPPVPVKHEFRVDAKLNIIADKRVKIELEKARLLEDVEKEKQIIWLENFNEQLQQDLDKIKINIKEQLAKQEKLNKEFLKLGIFSYPVLEEGVLMVDSLDIVSVVPWDSLENEFNIQIERIEKEEEQLHKSGQISEPNLSPTRDE